MASDDLARRWREAKLGERVGGRVAVWVECEGDPRAEVLMLSAERDELAAMARGQRIADGFAPSTASETGTVPIADPPPRRERKRGGRS